MTKRTCLPVERTQYTFTQKRLPKYQQMPCCLHNCNVFVKAGALNAMNHSSSELAAWHDSRQAFCQEFCCQQHRLSLHQTHSVLRDVIQLNTSLVTLHGRARSMRILRIMHWEDSDKITVKSFLLQQRGSFIHSFQ